MIYSESVYKVFNQLIYDNPLNYKKLHSYKLQEAIKEKSGRHPDVILSDGTYLDYKSSKDAGTLMFNSSIPTIDDYFIGRWQSKKKIILLNGSCFNMTDTNVILNNSLKFMLSRIHPEIGELVKEYVIKHEIDLTEIVGKSYKCGGGIIHRYRSMCDAINNHIFKIVSENTVSLIVPSQDHEIDSDIKHMSSQLNIESNSIDIKISPYYNNYYCLIYSVNYE